MGRHGNGFGKKGYSDQELQFENEDAKIQPWMIPVFAGIVVVIMLLCVLIWALTHREDRSVGNEAGESKEFSVIIDDDETGETAGTEAETEETEAETSETGGNTADGSETDGADGEGSEADESGGEGSERDESGTDENKTDASGADKSKSDASETDGSAKENSDQTVTGSEETATEQDTPEEPISGDTSMSFTAVDETVTAKDVLNLRSAPTTADSENVVSQLKNGESAKRIGVNNDTGWSKLEYNGQTVYAVSRYLTTDLAYKPPVQKTNPNRVNTLDGRVIIFTDCDDYISPKNYVNLRLEPSTSEGNATVHAQLNYGEVVHRTGYSADAGWSRVEYNGQVVYVVTSYMITVTVE